MQKQKKKGKSSKERSNVKSAGTTKKRSYSEIVMKLKENVESISTILF